MKWLGSHRSFVVETFFTNSGSITATQRLFRTHFKLGRHDPVPAAAATTPMTAAITPMMINRVIDNFHKRVNLCVNNHGKHLTDLIFKT